MNIFRSKLIASVLLITTSYLHADIETTCYYGHTATVKTQDAMKHFLDAIRANNNVRDQAIKELLPSIKHIIHLDNLKYTGEGSLGVVDAHKIIETTAQTVRDELIKQSEPFWGATKIGEAFARDAKHIIGNRLSRRLYTINKKTFEKALNLKKSLILNKNFREFIRDIQQTLPL